MVYLFTDFGFEGPYVGQMKSILCEQVLDVVVIDLMHDAPAFNSEASAYLLAAVAAFLPRNSILMGVVDPGVGSARKSVALLADFRWYVGPDNGLFDVVASRACEMKWYEIVYQNSDASSSFHGRDIYSPVVAMLSNGVALEEFLLPLERNSLLSRDDFLEIIYIDRFGNLMTGVRATDTVKMILFGGEKIFRANTFSDVEKGESFYYGNSQGLLEIAVSSGSAEKYFDAAIGDVISVR